MQSDEDRPSFRLQINASLGLPLYRQIMDGIKELIAAGTLRPGDQLPSIRELSAQLRINPSSAVKAYGELKHEDVIDMDQGRGTFVRTDRRVVLNSRDDVLLRAVDALIVRARTLGFSDEDLLSRIEIRVRGRRKPAKRVG
jgi:GntR family transcriptional regulator